MADASPRARAGRSEWQRTERTPRPFVDTARRQSMATNPDPLPKPKPDTIEPQAPPEEPVQHAPVENPDSQPQEITANPGGGDVDQPGHGPTEAPPRQY